MAKTLDVAALKAAGFTAEMIAKVQASLQDAPKNQKCVVVDYTTSKGTNYKALNVKTARVFVKVAEAKAVIEALTEGLRRAEAGEVDEVKAAAKNENPTE